MEWELSPLEEQETLINIDYFERTIKIYTNRKSVADRLIRKVGEPTKKYENNGSVYAIEYVRNLFDKDLAKFFSKVLLVGSFREKEEKEEE